LKQRAVLRERIAVLCKIYDGGHKVAVASWQLCFRFRFACHGA
jgi:hypothetical protein